MTRNTIKQGGLGTTIKQGIQMLQGKNVPNYTLIFLDPTTDKRSGEEQTVWNPYITLGRGSGSTIRYSDQYPTVSRKHAYIMIEGNRVFIEPDINATNPTLINNNSVQRKYELNPGDEIQLSHEGPRLRYINTAANRTTASMKFTQRLQQFGSQALRPYKTALTIMSILLIGLSSYFIWFSHTTNLKIDSQAGQISLQESKISEANTTSQNLRDSLIKMESLLSGVANKSSIEAVNIKNRILDLSNKINTSTPNVSTSSEASPALNSNNSDQGIAGELKQFEKSVYFIIIESVEVYHPEVNDKNGPLDLATALRFRWSGTGFMTSDGEFITARHIIEPWRFGLTCEASVSNDIEAQMKTFLNNAQLKGGNVEVTYKAISPSGDQFTFTNKNVILDNSRDRTKCNLDKEWHIKQCDADNLHTDWAKIILKNRPGKFKINREISRKLDKGTQLYGLGYSHGSQLQNFDMYEKFDNLDPLFISAKVVQQNTVNGMINISSSEIAQGSSGGPILCKTTNGWEVTGIISHGYIDGIKQLVPIWQVR
ncbi:MAG: FHA domain-containing protein [Saprospiraceae bacterium]|nr:FHA domain-containing protein [Saprospiraceae bacterium]